MSTEYVPDAPEPATSADRTATLEFDGFDTSMKAAVPATLPVAAVTVPETVNVPEPLTELGATLTVTESVWANTIIGDASTSVIAIEAIKTFLQRTLISSRCPADTIFSFSKDYPDRLSF